MTPRCVNIGQVEISAKVFKFPKVATLPTGHLLPTRAQLQNLRGIMGPSMQGRLEILHARDYFGMQVVWGMHLQGCLTQRL